MEDALTHGAVQLAERAPAKVNLTLRIAARRPDGYHELTSLVVFADVADELRLYVGETLALSVEGESAAQCGAIEDNLVLKAARALRAQMDDLRVGHFRLSKRLPVAAGIGGGSSDAAAALRLLARANALDPTDQRLMTAARATGADVPVCLEARARIVRGIGERLSPPLSLPALPAVLVFPGIAAPTAAVFARWAGHGGAADREEALQAALESGATLTSERLVDALLQSGNDLEGAAQSLFPVIGDGLAALRQAQGCRLARMSGSGSACFGLFATAQAAQSAATQLRKQRAHWWVCETALH